MSSNKNEHLTARAAGSFNDVFEPYFNQTHERGQRVNELYPEPDVSYQTPSFTKKDRSFTTQEEMMEFLNDVVATGKNVQMEIIGHSLEHREIPMLIYSTNAEGSKEFKAKPTIWLQALVHGSEPAAGESALVIAQELAKGSLTDVLKDINVIIIPRINPDSGYYFERNSTTNLNGNRDHINLEMVELQVLHETYKRFTPEVVIDAHEYGLIPFYDRIGEEGATKADDVLLLAGKNLNIPASIREKAEKWFINEPFKALDKKGYSNGSYYLISQPNDDLPEIQEGGMDGGTGRNAFALKPSFSILVETLGITIGREGFLRRVDSQVVTHTSIIRTAAEHAQEVRSIIADARKEIIDGAGRDTVILKSQQLKESGKSVKAVDIAKAEIIDVNVEYYSSSKAVAIFERKRPTAYLLPPSFHKIAKKLEILGAKVDQLEEGLELDVECFEVLNRYVSNTGDRPLSQLETSTQEKRRYFDKGSYVIAGAQSVAYLVSLALEPESVDSYFTYNFMPVYVGGELPVYRYMKENLSFINN